MNTDILIKVENLSKKFCKNLKGAILYGAKDITKNILGMQVDSSYLRNKEIDRRFDKIVEFAELEDFIDMPVKYYRLGMFVRLGFAFIAQMKPNVFLIDEVLAVGDVGFSARCYNYIAEVNKDATVVFVSHAIPQIARICDRVIVMDHGEKKFDGDVPIGIDSYKSLFEMGKK